MTGHKKLIHMNDLREGENVAQGWNGTSVEGLIAMGARGKIVRGMRRSKNTIKWTLFEDKKTVDTMVGRFALVATR